MSAPAGSNNSGGFLRDADGRVYTVSDSAGGSTSTVDLIKVNGTTTDTNSGNKSAGTQRVVLATDQPALTNALLVSDARPATATVTQVASSASSVTIQASNAARKGLKVYNDSTAILYLKEGTTASTSSYTVQVGPQQLYEFPDPCYSGRVDGIWAAANGNAYSTEETA